MTVLMNCLVFVLQIWVRKTSDSTKMRIFLGQLQRGVFVICRRSAAWNITSPPSPSVHVSIHPPACSPTLSRFVASQLSIHTVFLIRFDLFSHINQMIVQWKWSYTQLTVLQHYLSLCGVCVKEVRRSLHIFSTPSSIISIYQVIFLKQPRVAPQKVSHWWRLPKQALKKTEESLQVWLIIMNTTEEESCHF